mgnify:CR=1 FL=1
MNNVYFRYSLLLLLHLLLITLTLLALPISFCYSTFTPTTFFSRYSYSTRTTKMSLLWQLWLNLCLQCLWTSNVCYRFLILMHSIDLWKVSPFSKKKEENLKKQKTSKTPTYVFGKIVHSLHSVRRFVMILGRRL